LIRLGIVGCNYGRAVQLPAFRADSRCRVVALAGSDAARTAELARQSEIPEAYGDWRQMIARTDIDAVAIATPPRLQPEIAVAALKSGKPVLLIWGKDDKDTPIELSKKILEAVPQAEFHPVDDAAHIPHYEHPDIVNPIVLGFLSKRSD